MDLGRLSTRSTALCDRRIFVILVARIRDGPLETRKLAIRWIDDSDSNGHRSYCQTVMIVNGERET